MSGAILSAQGGRAAAIAHRQALSAGKSGLPLAQERVRTGKHGGAALPEPSPAPTSVPATAAPAASAPASSAPMPQARLTPSLSSGRAASMQRRRELSIGKSALPGGRGAPVAAAPAATGAPLAATGRLASMARRRQLSAGKAVLSPPPASATASPPAAAVASAPPAQGCAAPTCRDLARARRAAIAAGGRAGVVAAPAALTTPQGVIAYPAKVTQGGTQGGQRVTGIRTGEGRQVTGEERGSLMPVSGTQYIDTGSASAYRAAAPKVGQMRTQGGQTVSGTMVRSQVRITGDEAGASVTITGKADQRIDDDLTSRSNQAGFSSAQFQRQANPHGSTVFGTNLGRSVRTAGSRERSRSLAIETTEKGLAVTGSALGHSTRMTGDETGACRVVTGNQYLAPARAQPACGGITPAPGAGRADPVTASKVSVSESWGGQRITGMDVEHNPRVTGDEPGSCSALSGSQYQGRTTADGWCNPASARAASARRARHVASHVTGDTPMQADSVTGTARGAGRDITGTPYQAAEQAGGPLPADPVATLDTRFSVRSPQRAAHLLAGSAPHAQPGGPGRITGSFAVGADKVTGNIEFLAAPRARATGDKALAHSRISGEGMDGGRITGDAWGAHAAVTGTEGAFAAGRNPSARGPKAKAFAGSTAFKTQAVHEEPKRLVTGMFYFAKTGARVTLSGGAQG